MDPSGASTVTCPKCDETFEVDAMLPMEPHEEANTQVHWLVVGKCPLCLEVIEVSLDKSVICKVDPFPKFLQMKVEGTGLGAKLNHTSDVVGVDGICPKCRYDPKSTVVELEPEGKHLVLYVAMDAAFHKCAKRGSSLTVRLHGGETAEAASKAESLLHTVKKLHKHSSAKKKVEPSSPPRVRAVVENSPAGTDTATAVRRESAKLSGSSGRKRPVMRVGKTSRLSGSSPAT